jgi:hypothetical protein
VVASASAPLTAKPEIPGVSPSYFLGALGQTGLTAYVRMLEIGRPEPGETVVVSAAAGAVGSVAGQLAKIHGARVVGIAGGPEKCAFLTDDLGFDAAVDYKAPHWRGRLQAATPNGIDVDFENVGGEIMAAVFGRLNIRARVALCGLISGYNDAAPAVSAGPRNFGNLLDPSRPPRGVHRARPLRPGARDRPAAGRLDGRGQAQCAGDRRRRVRAAAGGDQHAVRRGEHRQARGQALTLARGCRDGCRAASTTSRSGSLGADRRSMTHPGLSASEAATRCGFHATERPEPPRARACAYASKE